MTTLAAACRPRRFDEVVGHEGTRWLLSSLVSRAHAGQPFPPAILLAGPSGTGKTSLARIVARALNCTQAVDGEPCLACPSCQQSLVGDHPAILEVDGARMAAAEKIRELLTTLLVAHPFAHQCIVIDEAHSLSRQAWDSMLRTLEACPDDTTFFFASTNPEKLRPEVLSRVHRFDLAPLQGGEVARRLMQVADAATRPIDEEIAFDLAERSHGNLRAALQLLQTVFDHPDGNATAVLGRSGFGLDLVEAAIRRDRVRGLSVLEEAWAHYGNAADIYADWGDALEQLLLLKYGAATTENPTTLRRLRDVEPAYHETMIAAGLEVLADWARRGGRRGSLVFAWTDFLRALNGPTTVDGLAAGAARQQARKATLDELKNFNL